jgi:hypothetical protein
LATTRITALRFLRTAAAGLALFVLAGLPAPPAEARGARERSAVELEPPRPVGVPLMAIVALREQHVTIYDTEGRILRAPVSTGQIGYETPAGIFSVIQKEAEHYSNLYDDASMPFMQRITWSGIALHAGVLPGYPASHGCIRMPEGFAEHLFELTRLGMRVLVVPRDTTPAAFTHPRLFKPRPGGGELIAAAIGRAGDGAQSGPGGAPVQGERPPLTVQAIAEAKAAEATEAARKSEAARQAALRAAGAAARFRRAQMTAEAAVARARAQLQEAEHAAEDAPSLQAVRRAAEARDRFSGELARTEAELAGARTAGEPAIAAAEAARDAVKSAEAARSAAVAAAREAAVKASPVSVFISRQTQRLYVRQALQPVFDAPIAVLEGDKPIGTHVFTALAYADRGAALRWNAVSMTHGGDVPERAQRTRKRHGDPQPADVDAAKAALDRISIPEEVAGRLSEVVSPGSSLIVSDETLSKETSKGTDFVVLMSDEPQGGIKIRRRNPFGYPMGYGRYYGFRGYGRPPYRGYSWW